jgi:hypothetical protein
VLSSVTVVIKKNNLRGVMKLFLKSKEKETKGEDKRIDSYIYRSFSQVYFICKIFNVRKIFNV